MLIVVRLIIMMFYYLNAYNVNINAQLAFKLVLIV